PLFDLKFRNELAANGSEPQIGGTCGACCRRRLRNNPAQAAKVPTSCVFQRGGGGGRGDHNAGVLYSPARRNGMNIAERNAPADGARALDMDRFRLRRFVEGLGPDELEERREATDLADIAAVLEGNAKAVLFHAVGRERQELVGNVTGSRARIARAFGVTPNELLSELLRRLRDKPQVIEGAPGEAPAREVGLPAHAPHLPPPP